MIVTMTTKERVHLNHQQIVDHVLLAENIRIHKDRIRFQK